MDPALLVALSIATVIAGLAALVWGADRFVLGASATAAHLGVSPLIIGLVIIGFGTSAPEMLVAVIAALQGNPGLGIGNAMGSNIANIGLIIGTTAVLWPLVSDSRLLRRELPLLLAVTAVAAVLLADGRLDRVDGVLFIAGLVIVGILLVHQARQQALDADPLGSELIAQATPSLDLRPALLWLGVGLAVLLAGSHGLVWGAVNIAGALGVSDHVIGLSVVAIGTSLPELATAIASARRREFDLVLGNIVGSNLFNSLAVLGLPALIHPTALEAGVLTRDLPVMVLLTLAFAAMLLSRRGSRGRIDRIEGTILLTCFGAYLWWLFGF